VNFGYMLNIALLLRKTRMSVIASAPTGGFDAPPDYQRHNQGITAKFFIKREPILDEKGLPAIDACGKPLEHEMEVCQIFC
jgi:hypothetical protein